MSGGSGGGWHRFPRGYPPRDIIKPASDRTDEKFLSTQVSNMLQEKLKEINAHDYEAIDRHKRAIVNKLKSEYEVEVIRFGGSHARITDVQGLSDVDVLVTLGDFEEGKSSNQLIADFVSALKERFPKTKVDPPGKMAATITFSDGLEIQILPAFRYRDGYRISDPSGKGWIKTFPNRFARELTSVNKKQFEKVVPTIKLIKTICHANNIDVKSYHLENMALKSFEHYTGDKTLPRMLKHFLNQAKSLCLKPIPDPSGQSKYVDGNLSKSERGRMARDFSKMETKIDEAMKSKSLERWTALFNE